jgi:hypothetical protein
VARFYFQFQDGDKLIDDPEGTELPDIEHARVEALDAAREIVAAAIRFQQEVPGQAIVIIDANGKQVMVVPLAQVLPTNLRQ